MQKLKRNMIHLGAIMASAFMLFSVSGATASLLGDSITCGVTSPQNCYVNGVENTEAVVGAGAEFGIGPTGPSNFSVDVGDSSIVVTQITGGPTGFDGSILLTLSGLDWVGMPSGVITGISSFFTNANAGIDMSNVTTSAHSIMIELGFSIWDNEDVLSFNIETDHAAIPEPRMLALFGFGLLVLGLARRKRTKQFCVANRSHR